jgi:hypothetical protein
LAAFASGFLAIVAIGFDLYKKKESDQAIATCDPFVPCPKGLPVTSSSVVYVVVVVVAVAVVPRTSRRLRAGKVKL